MTESRKSLLTIFSENHFTAAVFLCIIFAKIAPWLGSRDGPLAPEITAKYIAVSLIFYTSGLTVNWRHLSSAAKQYELHAFIQTFSFFIIPLFMRFFVYFANLFVDINPWIYQGLIIVGCMPPPVSSVVVLMKSMHGNEAAAIFNSALGSIFGIALTPLLLHIHVGMISNLPALKILFQLTETMFIPILLGQISQKFLSYLMISSKIFSAVGQISILFIIYSSFCDMFIEDTSTVDAHMILSTIFLIVLIQTILMYFTFKISCSLSKNRKIFSAPDIIAITFCSTHKSLTLGMPLLKTFYGGYSHSSHISLPLLIYHPVQLILGGFLITHCKNWLKENTELYSLFKRP